MNAKENRPAGNGTDSKDQFTDSTISPSADALVAGIFVAVVQIRGKHVPPRFRKRVYFNLPSAQRAMDRARMDGLEASIVLCQLVPVTGDDNA